MNKTLFPAVLLMFLCAGSPAQAAGTHGALLSSRPGNFRTFSQRSTSYTPGKVTMPPASSLKTPSTTRTYDSTNRQSPSYRSKQTGTSRTYQAPAVAKPLLDPDSTSSRVINGEAVPVSGARQAKTAGTRQTVSETKSETQEQTP